MNSEEQDKEKQTVQIPTWVASIIIVIFLVVMGVVLYLQFQRYKFIGQSLERGDTASAAMLFTPELSTSIASILYA